MEEERCVYGVLVGNPKGKSLLGRPRHRYRGNGTGFMIIFWAE